MNQNRKDGFTIVELLIVIVVIAILATISIVAYNGIQQRAKNTVSLSTVDQVFSKAGIWNATQGSFPDLAQLRTNSLSPTDIDTAAGGAGPAEAKLSNPGVAIGATMNEIRSENGRVVTYEPCWGGTSLTGAKVTYWSFSSNATVTVITGSC